MKKGIAFTAIPFFVLPKPSDGDCRHLAVGLIIDVRTMRTKIPMAL